MAQFVNDQSTLCFDLTTLPIPKAELVHEESILDDFTCKGGTPFQPIITTFIM
jgi:hypothetical protein